jgi:NADH-quinone oxidoreductase subunit J
MTLSTIFFILVGAVSVAGAVGVVSSRKPIYSALFLLVNFVSLAVLYITLDAQFLAAAQVIIYAGGIVILILFVIMLIGGEQINGGPSSARMWGPYVGVLLGMVMLATMVYSMADSFSAGGPQPVAVQGGIPEALGLELFTRYILPFELAAVLLLVALLGALLLARRPKSENQR